jgi:hypothetical protein
VPTDEDHPWISPLDPGRTLKEERRATPFSPLPPRRSTVGVKSAGWGGRTSVALIAKLECVTRLSAADKAMLRQLASEGVRQVGPREDIIGEGEAPDGAHLVLSGWAFRHVP